MKESHIIIAVIIGTVAIIGGGVFLSNKSNQAAQIGQTAEAKVAVASTAHSWGDIPINDGDVEATFAITNEGSEALQLFNVSTSCMCTTAQLEVNGQSSPEFGMHTKSRYVTEVPAGGTAHLRVVFDPTFHGPQGTGPITRQVRIQTNDASQPELMFSMDGTVI